MLLLMNKECITALAGLAPDHAWPPPTVPAVVERLVMAETARSEQALTALQDENTALREQLRNLKALHSDRVRICSFTVDPIQLTPALRRVDGTLRAEWDGNKVVVYSDVKLTQARMNALVALLTPQLDMT